MIYSCPCSGMVLNIPTRFFFYLTVRELEERCIEDGVPGYAEDPFQDSYMNTGDRDLPDPEDIDAETEEEDTSIDIDYSLCGYDD